MTEIDWQEGTDPHVMLNHVRGKVSERKLLLFACACLRHISQAPAEEFVRRAIAVIERRAEEGNVGEQEWRAVWSAPWDAWRAATEVANDAATGAWEAAREANADGDAAWAKEQVWQASVARCIFGNPYRVVGADPAWRTWTGAIIPQLCRAIYDHQRFDDLLILADQLEAAGCQDATILPHLRGPGPHARGCFALDLILLRG